MRRLWLIIGIAVLLVPTHAQQTDDPTTESEYTMPDYAAHYTYHQRSGNRTVTGSSTFPDVQTLDYTAFEDPVRWLLGMNTGQPTWLAMSDNQRRILDVIDETLVSAAPDAVPPRPPFLLRDATRRYTTFPDVTPEVAPFTHPVLLTDLPPTDAPASLATLRPDLRFVGVAATGDVLLLNGDGTELDRLRLDVQPDARPVVSATGDIALYANATDERYVHGIMGDAIEGAALVVLRATGDDTLELITRVDLPGDAVYEGLSPMWADINQDGTDDLVTTVSDSSVGSRLRVYLYDGEAFTDTVEGRAIGQPNRWQHQLAWDAFAPDGSYELVEVLTPHIGGVVRFYRFTGDSLEIVAQQPGYTSHVISSRNLDMAVAGDFNGDGQPEIVLPSQSRSRIAGIQRTDEGAEVAWALPLDERLSSNLSAVRLRDGRLALGAGTEAGSVRVWLPQAPE